MTISAAPPTGRWRGPASSDWSHRCAPGKSGRFCASTPLVWPVTAATGITFLRLCGLVDARVIDLDGIYDPCRPNDRLLLGMKGSIGVCVRSLDAARAKARRGELTRRPPTFAGLAENLDAAWNAPGVTMRTRQQPLRALVTNVIADVNEATREVVLAIHWRGGVARVAHRCRINLEHLGLDALLH